MRNPPLLPFTKGVLPDTRDFAVSCVSSICTSISVLCLLHHPDNDFFLLVGIRCESCWGHLPLPCHSTQGKFTAAQKKELFQLVARNNTVRTDVISKLGILERQEAAWKDPDYNVVWEGECT